MGDHHRPGFWMFVCACGAHGHADDPTTIDGLATIHQNHHVPDKLRPPRGAMFIQEAFGKLVDDGVVPVVAMQTLATRAHLKHWHPDHPLYCDLCVERNPQVGLEAFA